MLQPFQYRPRYSPRRVGWLLAIQTILVAGLPLAARGVLWTNPSGGAFIDGGNWGGGSPPGTSGSAEFGIGGSYAVTLTAPTTINQAGVSSGSVIVDVGNSVLTLASGLSVNPQCPKTAALEVRNGVLNASSLNVVSACRVSVVLRTRSSVLSGGDLTLAGGDDMTAPATIEVSRGAILATRSAVERGVASSVSVSGAGSSWLNAAAMSVDGGSISIDSGAALWSQDLTIAQSSSDGTGTAILRDKLTQLQLFGALELGKNGFGSMTISDGASANVAATRLASNFHSQASLLVSNGASFFTGPLTVAGQGFSSVRIVAASLSSKGSGGVPAATIGSNNLGLGLVDIAGPTATWTVVAQSLQGTPPGLDTGLVVGDGGYGELSVTDGATAESQGITVVGRKSGGVGKCTVSHATLRATSSYQGMLVGPDLNAAANVPGGGVGEVRGDAATIEAFNRMLVGRGGSLVGNMTISGPNSTNTALTNGGQIQPGLPIGMIDVRGTFAQTTTGVIRVDLSPEGNDLIRVSSANGGNGDAFLAGALSVSLQDGFVPTIGASFEILRARTISGTFDLVDLPPLPKDRKFELVVGPSAIQLNVVAMSLSVRAANADTDDDGVPDDVDNCTQVANPMQLDADHDGYGNACDADLDGNGMVNFVDLAGMKSSFFSNDPVADLNGDGLVNFVDLAIVKKAFFKAPGPAAGKP